MTQRDWDSRIAKQNSWHRPDTCSSFNFMWQKSNQHCSAEFDSHAELCLKLSCAHIYAELNWNQIQVVPKVEICQTYTHCGCFLPLRKGAVALHFIQKCPFPVDRDKPQETCISFSCAKYDRKESLRKEVQHKTLGSTNCKFILSILHGLNSLQGYSSCWEVRSLGNKDPWETDPSVLQVYSAAGKQPVSWSLEMNEIFLYYLT